MQQINLRDCYENQELNSRCVTLENQFSKTYKVNENIEIVAHKSTYEYGRIWNRPVSTTLLLRPGTELRIGGTHSVISDKAYVVDHNYVQSRPYDRFFGGKPRETKCEHDWNTYRLHHNIEDSSFFDVGGIFMSTL